MGQRWVMGLVAVVAIVAIGGIGFAAFSTSAYISASAAAGTFGPLYWSGAATPTGSEAFDACSSSIGTTTNTSDTFDLTAGNLAPGDYCSFSATLNNGGSIPASVYAEVSSYTGAGCPVTTLFDSLTGPVQPGETTGTFAGPILIGAYGSVPYSAELALTTTNLGLPSGVGNADQGVTCTFTVTFSATAGD
ncbi:MAG: hypothetical protein WA688_01485 [Thermoplasmata archaeon]